MAMHLNISKEDAEMHSKAGYRNEGKYFVLKMSSSIRVNPRRVLSTGTGMVMLWSEENAETTAASKGDGALADSRTAAVAALMAKEMGRKDTTLRILRTGVQARWQAESHAEVLKLK
jgi:ornithine cyclodeaminase/alanine dehydrogenase-like protein (mu-crystallin family)